MIKFKLILLSLIISSSTVLLLGTVHQKQTSTQSDLKSGFYIGPMNFFFEERLRTQHHFNCYDSLYYNMMHNYCGHFDSFPTQWINTPQRDGGFFEDTSNYAPYIRNVILQWHQYSGRVSLIMEREKILRPAYGQRFTFQAENQGKQYWLSRFPAYGYDSNENMTGTDITEYWFGEPVSVRRCIAGVDKPGYIVKNLIENYGQVNDLSVVSDRENSSGHPRLFSDIKQPKYQNRWFIKPRMRIDSIYAKTHPQDTVVVIYVKNYRGDYITSFPIRCSNFLDSNLQYNGNYIENYYNLPANYLSVRADSLAIGAGSVNDCKVDYIVKWLGKVDVWLDYVRVDDSWAHFLFTSSLEQEIINDITPWEFHLKIKEEVDAFKDIEGLAYFWIDEVQFPNLECIAEVNRLVKQYSNNKLSVLFISDPISFMGWSGLKYKRENDLALWDSCINFAYNSGALCDIMVTQWYPVFYNIKFPSNLHINLSDSFPATRFFTKATNYSDYTYSQKGIQSAFSWFLRNHKFFCEKAKSLGLIYAVVNQTNSDESAITGTGGADDWGLREPTCEEISAILNISVAYGAKILFEFSYTTSMQKNDAAGYRYNMGLTTSQIDNYSNKRYFNYYYQEKWNFIAQLNKRLYEIGNFMYPYNSLDKHLNHQITISTDSFPYTNNFPKLPYSYITDIRSLAPLMNGVNPCMSEGGIDRYYDCPEQRYWELGFFSSPLPEDSLFTKYLYVVNKRTFPNINNDGDIRILEIKFNPDYLPVYNDWIITEVPGDSLLKRFNKYYNNYIPVALFQPGEGKLLKIIPVDIE